MCKSTAIILAGGSGKRMGSNIPKQYLEVEGKPILYYTLRAFEESEVDEIIVVVAKEQLDYVKNMIVNKFNLTKVTSIVSGGEERYLSVYEGIKEIKKSEYILVHDGARPLITAELINTSLNEATIYGSSVVAVPTKDTVRIVDKHMSIEETPSRDKVWMIQTPQTFRADILVEAYQDLITRLKLDEKIGCEITDDAMVVERVTTEPIHITMGDYRNIKVTTKEDIKYVELYMYLS